MTTGKKWTKELQDEFEKVVDDCKKFRGTYQKGRGGWYPVVAAIFSERTGYRMSGIAVESRLWKMSREKDAEKKQMEIGETSKKSSVEKTKPDLFVVGAIGGFLLAAESVEEDGSMLIFRGVTAYNSTGEIIFKNLAKLQMPTASMVFRTMMPFGHHPCRHPVD